MLLNTFCCEYSIKRLYLRIFRPIFGRSDIFKHLYLAKAAGFPRGLFLLLKRLNNGVLYIRNVYYRIRPEYKGGSVSERQGSDLFWRIRQRLWHLLLPNTGRVGATEGIYRPTVPKVGRIAFIEQMEAAGTDLSRNRYQGGRRGITILPKSLLNSTPRTQHYPVEAYADTPSALMLGTSNCVGVGVFFFFCWFFTKNTYSDLASSTRNPLLWNLENRQPRRVKP